MKSKMLHRNKGVFLLTIIISAALLCGLISTVMADTHYVSSTGSNTSPYTSWAEAAWAIQDAINVATSGDSVVVDAGIYNENIIMKDGVNVTNDPGDGPAIDGDGTAAVVTFDDEFSLGCSLDGFDISDSGTYPGIYVHGTGSAGK